jgi:hypothetical protein
MAEAEGRQMTIRERIVAVMEAGLTGDRKEECLMILMAIGRHDTEGRECCFSCHEELKNSQIVAFCVMLLNFSMP